MNDTHPSYDELARRCQDAEAQLATLLSQLTRPVATSAPDADKHIPTYQAFLAALIAQLPIGVFVKDALHRRILLCNHAAEALFGRRADEMIGKTADALFPRQQAEFIQRTDSIVVREKRQMEVARVTLDNPEKGPRIWRVNKAPMLNAAGEVEYILYYGEDITEREQMEAIVQEKDTLLEGVLNSALSGVMAFTACRAENGSIVDFTWQLVNETAEKMVGRTQAELLGKRLLQEMPGNKAEGLFDRYVTVVETGMPLNHEHYYAHEQVKTWFHTLAVKLGDGFVVTFTDVTEHKRAEAEREKLQAQLMQAQKMESVGRLAGGIAHDFNNMLGVIIGCSELALLKVDPAQPLQHDLREIQRAAERSAELTRQLLAFARKQTVAPRVLDLNETVGSMSKMLRRLIGEDIELIWCPGRTLWPVQMDPIQVDQMLANLCVNARDAISGIGNVTIETQNIVLDEAYCATHAQVHPGEYVLLAVSDNGCGMDAELQTHLFEPFFTTKGTGKGTGLGLATVYGVVKQNNGVIEVYSEPGHGAAFKIYFPRHVGQPVTSPEARAAEQRRSGPKTILLVEDESAILALMQRMLEQFGFQVLPAGTPHEAIQQAEAHPGEIALLITDVVMPEMNGRDLARRLLTIYPGMKRLFMSGYTADVIAHHGVLDEGIHFLQKPFSMSDLGDKVREALEQ